MQKVFIAAAKRTAIGSFMGTLADVPAPVFTSAVVRDILSQTQLPPEAVDEVIVGNVLSAGMKQGPARQVSIGAGIPETVTANAVNIACGSGMKAVANATAYIKAGLGNVYIAGGMENMSASPYLIHGARQGLRMGSKELVDENSAPIPSALACMAATMFVLLGTCAEINSEAMRIVSPVPPGLFVLSIALPAGCATGCAALLGLS